MKSGSRAQQKAMTASEFAAHCGSLTIQTTATAPETALNAPIPASEGKDTTPQNSDLVATVDAQLQDLAAEIERIRNTLAKLNK